MMQAISLYQPRNTFIHQSVDPFTKLTYLLCSMLAAFFVPSFIGAGVFLALNVALLFWAKELGRAAKTLLGSLVIVVSIFVIQGMFNPANQTLLWVIGPVHFYREGLAFGLTITFRLVNIIAASSLLVLTTSPSSVVEACVRRGLSPRIGYVLTSILQIIPVMSASVHRIQEAQRSRGLPTQGGVWQRAKAFLPVFGPVVLSSLMGLHERAMALEVRGFSAKGRKTFYREEKVHPSMLYVRVLIFASTIAIVVWGIIA